MLDAALAAPAVVVGVVGEVEALDAVALRAELRIETSLSGDLAAGTSTAIAWEELARQRPRRFERGSRILVVLEPLPGWSIWRQRLGERSALGVARRGEAFLRDPDPQSVAILARLLARPGEAREGPAGITDLTALVAEGAPPLARAALDRLDATPGLAARLSPEAEAHLRRAIGDAERPLALRAELLRVVGGRSLAVFAPDVAEATAPGSPLAPEAIAAWLALGHAPSEDEVAAWLARPEPAVRAALLRHAPQAISVEAIRARLESDADEGVRSAAVGALVARRGIEALPTLTPLLGRPDAPEGAAAARSLGELGEPAVAPLVAIVRDRPFEESRGALLALSLAGPRGQLALRGLADSHPDALVRGLAGFLLGRPPRRH